MKVQPDRELHYKYGFLRDMPMKRFISSMGCPYPCTFCCGRCCSS